MGNAVHIQSCCIFKFFQVKWRTVTIDIAASQVMVFCAINISAVLALRCICTGILGRKTEIVLSVGADFYKGKLQECILRIFRVQEAILKYCKVRTIKVLDRIGKCKYGYPTVSQTDHLRAGTWCTGCIGLYAESHYSLAMVCNIHPATLHCTAGCPAGNAGIRWYNGIGINIMLRPNGADTYSTQYAQ
ncbi:hypothetical protein FQZ97_755550 [compost metagenome]